MSLLKAQVRVAVTNDIGADLDDQLEHARRDVQQQEGAKAAYSTAHKLIEQLLPHLQKDIESGKYDLQQGAEIAKWIQRAMGVCESMSVQASHLLLSKNGAVAQNERLVALVKKRLEIEQAKVTELAKQPALVDQDEVDLTAAPTAPKSIKQIRLEEAAREAAAAQAEAKVDEPPPPPTVKSNGKRGKGSRSAAHA